MMNILVKAVQYYAILTTGKEERQALAMDIVFHHKEAFDYAYDFYCLFNTSIKMTTTISRQMTLSLSSRS
jgi:hypothetical protein